MSEPASSASDAAAGESGLTVAVTGPTGTFGEGLIPLLQADERVARVVGIARRPFDPATRGWSKMQYRRGDVRDPDALLEAFRDADVVVHLAFLITGTSSRATARAINVDGTLNTFRAAAAAGARRFVYASSVAAYGFHADNPLGMTEDWPVRAAARLFYAQEKAELEHLLASATTAHPDLALYLLRPPIVLGPHALGAKDLLPGPLAPLGRRLAGAVGRAPVRFPFPVPALPLQLVHEADVGQALLLCAVGAGPPGPYNIAGDGVLTTADVARELGLTPVPVPLGIAQATARRVSALPFLPPGAEWIEAAGRPSIMDTTRARTELGWRPRYSGLEALRDTLRRGDRDQVDRATHAATPLRAPSAMTDRSQGIPPRDLDDDDLHREVKHLHETRHDTLLGGSESALEAHTRRMLALEEEFLHRFPAESVPDPRRTRAGSRELAGQPVPGRDLDGAPG